MISEQRLAANRQNAQRSTGPRTEAGKEQSRRNSLKHGLTGAGVVFTDDDAAQVEAKRAAFAATIEPENEVEAVLVERMALASVRMTRCVQVDRTRRKIRQERARRAWESERQGALEFATQLLATDAAEGRRLLGEMALGCAWMVDEWQALGSSLSMNGCWGEEELAQALRLLGKAPDALQIDDELVGQVLLRFVGALPEVDFDHADALLGINTSALDPEARTHEYCEFLPPADDCRAGLSALIETQVKWLEARQAQALNLHDQRDVARCETLADVDSSVNGMRLARYEAMNELAFHRNWNAIVRLRKTGAQKLGVKPSAALEPEAQNEPIMEPSSPEAIDIYECAQVRTEGPAEAVSEPSLLAAVLPEVDATPFEPAATAFEAAAMPTGVA